MKEINKVIRIRDLSHERAEFNTLLQITKHNKTRVFNKRNSTKKPINQIQLRCQIFHFLFTFK